MNRNFKVKWSHDSAEDLTYMDTKRENKVSFLWKLFFTYKKEFNKEMEYIKAGIETLQEILQYEIDKEIMNDILKVMKQQTNNQATNVNVRKIGKFNVYLDKNPTKFDHSVMPKFKDSIAKMWVNYWETGKATIWPSIESVFKEHDARYIYAPYIPLQFSDSLDVIANKWTIFMMEKCGGVKTRKE